MKLSYGKSSKKFQQLYQIPDDSLLQRIAIELISSCYADPTVSLKFVNPLVYLFDGFLNSDYFNAIKEQVFNCDSNNDKEMIVSKLEFFQNALKPFNSEYKRLKALEQSGYFIEPEPIFFNSVENNDGFSNIAYKELRGQIIPLGSVLKAFLELPNVFDTISNYCSELEKSDRIHNIIQTDFWKSKVDSNKITFPLLLYEDAYETGNPLGSHAGTYNITAIYVMLACLPPNLRSR